jgi:hypothetical protein
MPARAAYDALPEDMKRRLHGLVVEHSIFNSRARLSFTEFSDEERAGVTALCTLDPTDWRPHRICRRTRRQPLE